MPADRVEVFVPGPLTNPMNGSHGHWSKHARWARQWRERAGMALLAEHNTRRRWPWPASSPKRIRLIAFTWSAWDDDNLRAGCKPVRDALRDAGLVQGDAPSDGHEWMYAQRIDRAHRGVRIIIEARGGDTA